MSVSAEKRARTLRVFGGMCGYCMRAPAARLSRLVPPSRGGTDAYANLVPACEECLAAKGDLTVAEWLAWSSLTGSACRRWPWRLLAWTVRVVCR